MRRGPLGSRKGAERFQALRTWLWQMIRYGSSIEAPTCCGTALGGFLDVGSGEPLESGVDKPWPTDRAFDQRFVTLFCSNTWGAIRLAFACCSSERLLEALSFGLDSGWPVLSPRLWALFLLLRNSSGSRMWVLCRSLEAQSSLSALQHRRRGGGGLVSCCLSVSTSRFGGSAFNRRAVSSLLEAPPEEGSVDRWTCGSRNLWQSHAHTSMHLSPHIIDPLCSNLNVFAEDPTLNAKKPRRPTPTLKRGGGLRVWEEESQT
jgi:hypothetical protein